MITLRRRPLTKTILVTTNGEIHSGMVRLPPNVERVAGLRVVAGQLSPLVLDAEFRAYLMGSVGAQNLTFQQVYDLGLPGSADRIEFAIANFPWSNAGFTQYVTAGDGEHLWVMVSYNPAEPPSGLEFRIDGIEGGFLLAGSASINQGGGLSGPLDYHFYRSVLPNLGNVQLDTWIVLQ